MRIIARTESSSWWTGGLGSPGAWASQISGRATRSVVWVSVGSTHFDDRSFRLGDDANLNIYDAAFAADQVQVFEDDKTQSRWMMSAEFKNRSAVVKFLDEIAGTLRRQL